MFIVNYSDPHFYVFRDLQSYSIGDFDDFKILSSVLYFKYEPDLNCYVFNRESFLEFTLWCDKFKWGIQYQNRSVFSEAKKLETSLYSRETKFFRNEDLDLSILTDNTKLFDYQIEGIKFFLSRSRWYNMDDMGLGKTIQTIFTVSQLYKSGKIDGIFLVTKNGLSYHWVKEFLLFSKVFNRDDILLVNNKNKRRVFDEANSKKIIITPNHLLADIFVSYRKRQKKVDKKTGKLKRINNSDRVWNKKYFSIKKQWGKTSLSIIIDEAHTFKNSKATWSKALNCFISEFEYRGFLSGTPSINRFEEYFFQMKLLDPFIFNQTQKSFLLSISRSIGTENNPWAINLYDEKKILFYRERLKMNCLKRVKEDLPEMKTRRIIKKVFFELSPIQKQLYDYFSNRETEENKANHRKITNGNIFRYFTRVCQCVDNTVLLDNKIRNDYVNKLLSKYEFGDDPRLTYLDDYLRESIEDLGEKVVIFDTHPLTLDLLEERYYNYKPITIHGSKNTGEEERQRAQEIFNDQNSECKLILLSSLTSSTGLNLQKGSHKVVFFTTPWNTTDYRQALDRTYRITSEKDTIITIFVFDNTIDVVRVERNLDRTEFNDTYLNKELNEEDIGRLLNGL